MLTREYPPDVYGGAGVHVEYLARELARQRVEQGHVRPEEVALHREVLGPEPVEAPLGLLVEQEGDDQRVHTTARAPLPSTVTPPALTW